MSDKEKMIELMSAIKIEGDVGALRCHVEKCQNGDSQDGTVDAQLWCNARVLLSKIHAFSEALENAL